MSTNDDRIKHVILLMLENRSFDQMLGCFQEKYPTQLDGIDPTQPKRWNADPSGKQFFQESTNDVQTERDPHHETAHVLRQIGDNNSGFIRDFVEVYPGSTQQQRQQVMSYYPLMFLDALHRLARDFTICDHWFSSLPGPTWPNRFFALSGTSSGRVMMPEGITHPNLDEFFKQDQTTIFDRLNEAGRTWKVYFYDFACSLILNRQRREPANLANYFGIDQFFKEVRDEAHFPDFCLIEPKYAGRDQNDDHPPHNTMKAEKLIADVYNAIRSRPDLWQSSLLVVVYDEHGGFYDHVPPPATIPPDEHHEEYTFDRLGVRVPAILVSPWVDQRVENSQFDHTSLLKYLTDKWSLGPLGARTAAANSIGVAIQRTEPREDTLPFIRVSQAHLTAPRPELEFEDSSVHHAALDAFGQHLLGELDDTAAAAIQKVARAAGLFTRLKDAVGRRLIAAGAQMTADFELHNRRRMEMITNVILTRIRPPAGPRIK